MRILIDNVTIVTMNRERPLISNGYVYVDKGMVLALGEGEPPEEYQFADYIIDGSGRILLPGFSLGFADPVRMIFRHVRIEPTKLLGLIESITSKREIHALFGALLASLQSKGFTSVTVYAHEPRIARALARASSDVWLRTRVVLPSSDRYEVLSEIRRASREVSEPDAIARGIVSFGICVNDDSFKTIAVRYPEYHVYVYSRYVGEGAVPKNVIALGHSDIRVKRVVIDDFDAYVIGDGFGVMKSPVSTPTVLLLKLAEAMGSKEGVYEDSLRVLTTWNYVNSDIGLGEIREGMSADLILLNFREPPSWPMIVKEPDSIYKAIVEGDYVIETVIVGGEVVVDKGENLMVGRALINRAKPIVDELCKAIGAKLV